MALYDIKNDYMAEMNDAAAKGDYARAALAEQARNYKIMGEGLDYQTTNQYSAYLPTSSGYTETTKTGTPVYVPGKLPSATNLSSQINSQYDAAQDSALQALRGAYDKNMLTLDQSAAKIPEEYQTARNQTATQAEMQKQAMNESFAASGLNTGAGSQAELARSNVLQSNLSAIGKAEANALAEVENQRALLKAQYQNDVAQAIADGNLARAQALYAEAQRVDDSIVQTALNQADENYRAYGSWSNAHGTEQSALENKAATLAQWGDFSGYKALGYSDEQIAAMKAEYEFQRALELGQYNTGSSGSGGGSRRSSGRSGGGSSGGSSGYSALTGSGQKVYNVLNSWQSKAQTPLEMGIYLNGRRNSGEISDSDYNVLAGIFGLSL